nr:M28 family peptidase [Hymenobacter sp. AT01-02]
MHNGADDDGSGTVTVLEMAEAFTKPKPKATVPAVAYCS